MPPGENAPDSAPDHKSQKAAQVASAEHDVSSQASTLLRDEANGRSNQDSEKAKASSDALGSHDRAQEYSPFQATLDNLYGARQLTAARRDEVTSGELLMEPIAGYDTATRDGARERGGRRALPGNATELARGADSSIIKEKNGAITDRGNLNGQQYDITASKDKDTIVWKDKDGKEHRFERKKGENSNEYTDGDGTRLIQNGDRNKIIFKNGYQVEVDARTGRTVIADQQGEVAQYNGRNAVRRQIDDNNVAYQVRGDVGDTVQQIRNYQQQSGEAQRGNILIKNEKGDTVILQKDGTEISRKADSPVVTIKKGNTTITHTPGQKPVITGGDGRVTQLNGGIQLDGNELINNDGSVIISGMQNGRLDSRYGRIYGTTARGGQLDLGVGRAIADDLTTQNTGTGVKAITKDNQVIMETGADSRSIQTGPITTNVDQTNPTTRIDGGDGIQTTINNNDGSSRTTDHLGDLVAQIDPLGNMDIWDGTHFGEDGNIWNDELGLEGWTNFDSDGASSFYNVNNGYDDSDGYYTYTNSQSAERLSDTVAKASDKTVAAATSALADVRSLASGANVSLSTLGVIDTNIGNLSSMRSQIAALLHINPRLYSQLGAIDSVWAQLSGMRQVVQNQVTSEELLRTRYGVSNKDLVVRSAALGGNHASVDRVAQFARL